MGRYCLCAVAGAFALNLWPQLPPGWLLAVVAALTVACLARFRWRCAGFLLLGFLAAGLAGRAVIGDRLPRELEGDTFVLHLRVTDFPRRSGRVLQFRASSDDGAGVPGRLRLSWFDPPQAPRLGEVWALEVRLRRPRGFANPGGFDYEGWLFRQAIGATGYVVNGAGNRRLALRAAGVQGALDGLRRHFVGRSEALLPDDEARAVLNAIAVGARHAIRREQWDRYAVTGTSHLMAISGLHIGLAGGGAFLLAWALLSAGGGRYNVRDAALVVAIVVATLYAALSGFAVPARRASLMAGLAAAAVLARRRLPAAQVIAVCTLVVLLTDPLSILAPGFKLSFAAVSWLIWRSCQLPASFAAGGPRTAAAVGRGLRQLGGLQMTLLFGLFPLTALLFARAAWLGPAVNLLALPVFSFLVVPLALLGMLLDGPLQFAGDALLGVAHVAVGAMLWLIGRAAALPHASVGFAGIGGLGLLLVSLPALHALLPPGWPGRRLAWVALLASVWQQPAAPPAGCVDVHVLDVGQGLAVVLQTAGRVLVYDTGPAFRSGSTSADLVLLPFLRYLGSGRPDLLVVSHGDLDHAGGVAALLRAYAGLRILSGEALPGVAGARCQAGRPWRWDGVAFEFLHPQSTAVWRGNNASCVLQLRAGPQTLLLAGDIESPVEKLLLRRRQLTGVSLVVVPHHGSRTSSSPGFVQRLRPQTAVVSAGYRNRWGLPLPEVVARWRAAGAEVLTTAVSGAISRRYCSDGTAGPLREQRRQGRRYWHERNPYPAEMR